MPSIADRIRWVIDSKKVKSGSAWATSAGLPRTYLSRYLHGERHGAHSDMGVETAEALATAAGLRPAWLAYGDGNPEEVVTLPHNLAVVLSNNKHYSEALVHQALAVRQVLGESDLPSEVWTDYLDTLRREARRLGLELAAARLDG